LLFAYYGKFVFSGIAAADVKGCAVFGAVVIIPGFIGGPAGGKNPADFEFPLRGDEGGMFENL
jgi:hypothetical protein